ncbi:sigma-70 family RNA polymerase sigma factor [Janibacter limosus]|uniref:sigma-70 family RNA polymerase sigma factor n=1 Tax=Janibacter limosus TaxID=53458 RepID=UPI0013EE6332|nr:sigma-70 family RNA polymerase sigma factor [Janibacter limosus]
MRSVFDESFEDFIAVRGPELFRVALAMCGDPGRAEDIVQDVYAVVYPRWERIAALEQPYAYVRRSVVNRFLALNRRRASTEVVGLHEDRAESTDGGLPQVDAALSVLDLIQHLPPRARAILALRYLDDMTDAAIAELLEIKRATVAATASRALRRLAQEMPELKGAHDDR